MTVLAEAIRDGPGCHTDRILVVVVKGQSYAGLPPPPTATVQIG